MENRIHDNVLERSKMERWIQVHKNQLVEAVNDHPRRAALEKVLNRETVFVGTRRESRESDTFGLRGDLRP